MDVCGTNPGWHPDWVMTLPPEHPLNSLREICAGEAESQPPRLDFLPAGEAMPAADPKLEMRRFRILIDHAARTRLCRAVIPGAYLEEGSLVLVSSDKMAAWLFLFPPVGVGPELTTPQLLRALLDHDVTGGIDWRMLRLIPKTPDRYFTPLPIARGTPPRPGRGGRVIDRVPRTLEGQIQAEGLGLENYTTLRLVRDIGAGDVICEIVPPGPGVPGSTVTGEEIPAPSGQPAEPPAGRNTRLTEDGRFLVAACAGHVSFTGRSFQVKPVLHLDEADLSPVSSVNFLGDVHIHCDLPGGASVRATGNIQIDGAVENCSVEAGENIIVSSGVHGQNQATLYAHKQVYAKYLEHCAVYALQDVFADCIINCDVYSNGTVQARTGRGVLIGGTIRAARKILAGTAGSKAERPIHLVLGGRPCEAAQGAQLQDELQRIAGEIDELLRQPVSSEREARLAKLRMNRCIAQAKLDKVNRELEALLTLSRQQRTADTQVVCGAVYPGVLVTIDGVSLPVDRVRQDCTIGLIGDRVRFL